VQVTLIHSPTAGEGHPTRAMLMNALAQAGHDPVYRSSDEAEWHTALDAPADLVVVAGGDGTVKEVALVLAGRDVPLAVVPAGTANNIAFTLGVCGSLHEIVATWERARRVRLDVGVTRGPWGERRFVEAVGFGAFARTIRDADDLREAGAVHDANERDQRLVDDLRMLRNQVRGCRAAPARFVLDGDTISGRYVLASVMSIRAVGPNLLLAPEADPGDGLLDVVLVSEDAREHLVAHLDRRLAGSTDALSSSVRRARRVLVEWGGPDVHFDSEIWPERRELLRAVETPLAVEIELTGASVLALSSLGASPEPGRVAVT
jgi:diacylglycerol kinase (ATP)